MHKIFITSLLLCLSSIIAAQNMLSPLTVEKIMRDPKWIGTSPSEPQWNRTSDTLYFLWNPEQKPADSLYFITLQNKTPQKATPAQKMFISNPESYTYNGLRNQYTFEKNGDIFLVDIKIGQTRRITSTTEYETNPQFSFSYNKIVYSKNSNLYAWDITSGETQQLTNFNNSNNAYDKSKKQSKEEVWLQKNQLVNFDVLRERKAKTDSSNAYKKTLAKEKGAKNIAIGDAKIRGLSISPNGRFINYRLLKENSGRETIVPEYVTESGYTTDIPGRTKVGAGNDASEYYVYDRLRDTVFSFPFGDIPGIKDIPDYLKDYPTAFQKRKKADEKRAVSVRNISWSPKGSNAVVEIRSNDHKDRWLMLWDMNNNKIKLLDRQTDEAWIAGPGINGRAMGWLDEDTFWFQSEATGYSHLYTINVNTLKKISLTTGNYEVQQVKLSADKKKFFITTNQVHPGEKQFYTLNIATGRQEKITTLTGSNMVTISPDEKNIAILYSYTNKPWELYLQENRAATSPQQITFKAQTPEFQSYPWRDAEVISFTASDGAQVYARIYKPANPHPSKPAILFIHGAGYLQNAHKWWSSYFREYMFNNLLADNGYYVMDIDYRGSAGYGRNWRTGIYRHMGGKDLADHVDAVDYLVKKYGVNPKHIGLYGGSYGGFLTLMGMFTKPDVFSVGAALRPVTDWANYNDGYTSDILNEPYNDSIAYYRSSPIYFANGLKGHLLICHGMIDVNVHFQDAVKLSQRLIELGKDNWELAPYPMEDHAFVEHSSWTDEYKRIFKLFERVLKKED